MLPVFAKSTGGRNVADSRFSFFKIISVSAALKTIINTRAIKTFPATESSICFFEREDKIRHGMAMYITNSFIDGRLIFLNIPNR